MIYRTLPEGFAPSFEVVSCFIEAQREVLFLLRQDHKSEGGRWGVPAGKIENGETTLRALVREIKEETGLDLLADEIRYFEQVYVRYPGYDFIYHMFHVVLDSRPDIKINPAEHKEFCWAVPREALGMDLIQDEDVCIKLLYGLG